MSFDLTSMLMLGILGTGHCLGMCGPLVFALPGQQRGLTPHLAYHGGRVGMYTLVGLLMGALGGGMRLLAGTLAADPMAWMAAVQTGFGFVAAILLGGLGLVRLGLMPEPGWLAAASPSRIPGIGRWLRTAATKGRGLGMVATGAVMGLLPCGLSFAAFARALGAAHPLGGAGLTLAFGLGTLPGLLLLGAGLAPLARRYRRASDLLAGLLMVVMALQLVVQTLAAFAS